MLILLGLFLFPFALLGLVLALSTLEDRVGYAVSGPPRDGSLSADQPVPSSGEGLATAHLA